MQTNVKKKSTQLFSAGPFPLVAGLVASLAIAALLSMCLAQPAIRYPVPGAANEAIRQRAVQIEWVLATYLPNRADVRFSDMGSSSFRQGSWLKLLIQFTSQPDWIDEVRFDCYVLLRDGNRDTMLSGAVTCSHVRAGRQHLTCLFVPPSVLERYGRAVRVAVECYYQNNVVSDYSVPRATRKWWEDYTAVGDAMVSWFYTPFLRDGIERYEHVKTAGQGF